MLINHRGIVIKTTVYYVVSSLQSTFIVFCQVMHRSRQENVCQVRRVCDTVCSSFVVKNHFELHMKDSQVYVNTNIIIHMRISKFQIMTLITQFYLRVCILLAFGRNVHYGIISLTKFRTIKLLYPHQYTNPGERERERAVTYICVRDIDFVYDFLIECQSCTYRVIIFPHFIAKQNYVVSTFLIHSNKTHLHSG